jgi:multisubunit Na+/H+ antiporter MnhC subunit
MLKLETSNKADSDRNAAKLTSALVTVVSSLSSAVPMIALGVLAMSQPVDALSPGGDQTRHPNISDKFREMVEEFVVPLVQSLMTAAIVVFFHVVVCRCIQAGATSGVLHQRGMHKARWHSLYALFVSTGSTYLLHNGGEPPEAIFVVALIAICFLSTERFSFYFFRYHGRPSFDHGFIPLVSGSILSAFLHAIDYLGCAPLAFWFSVLLGPLLSRALQSTNMNLLGAGRTAVEQGSAAVRIEGTDARDDNAGGDATATGDNGLFVVGDENGSIDIADIADIAIGYGA